MRDIVSSEGAVVAADQYAAQAGADILRRGGNAVDAIVAALLVECVVQPHNVGLGGYAGTMVVYSAEENRVAAVDFDSVAPLAATPGMFSPPPCTANWDVSAGCEAARPGINERGFLSITAPPIVAGLATALERFGSMSFSDLAEAAERYAFAGFAVYPQLAQAIAEFVEHADEESARAVLGDARPRAGDILVQKDLGKLISVLRRDGPRAFYEGDVPGAIVRRVRSGGGILAEADLTEVTPRVEDTLSVSCGGYGIHTPMPPAGGLTALQVLRVAELAGFSDTDLGAARYYHVLAEAAKHAWADRFANLGDPLFVDVPMTQLLSEAHARDILCRVADGEQVAKAMPDGAGVGHTVHLVACDSHRNMVSLTATHGGWFGSMVAVDGLGLVLGHGMSRFSPVAGQANSIAPGKRMQHNMSPLIITRDGRPYCAIGLPGGRKIVSVTALLAHSVARFGLSCGQAMDLPRFHVEGRGATVVDSLDLADRMKHRFGPNYGVQVCAKRIGGPVAGIMHAREAGLLVSASEAGPACVATV